MGQVTKNISKAFPGRSAILPVVALVVVLCVMSGEARAGAILPLAQQPDPINFALPIDQSSSSGAPAEPASESNHDQQSNRKVAGLVSIDGLAETGGASIPVNSAAGTAASAALAALDSPAAPRVASSFRVLREQRVQLPHPPLGELLDPPKACS